jgi:hypothetical protein
VNRPSFLKRPESPTAAVGPPGAQTPHASPQSRSVSLSAAEIARRIEAVRVTLPELEQRQRSLALAVESGLPDSEANLASAAAELRKARERLALLQDAQTEARDREAEQVRKAAADIRASKVTASKKHLALFGDAAAAFAPALAEAAKQYRLMLKHGEAAALASPDGAFPKGSMTTRGELREAAMQEISRVGGDGRMGASHNSFPGGKFGPGKVYVPESLEPFEPRIKQGVTRALEALK